MAFISGRGYSCVKAGSVHHYYLNGERIEAREIPEAFKRELRCKAPTYAEVERVGGKARGRFSCREVVRLVHGVERRHKEYYEDDEPIAENEVPPGFRSITCAEEREEEEAPPPRRASSPPSRSPPSVPPPVPRKPTRLRAPKDEGIPSRFRRKPLPPAPKRKSPAPPVPPPRGSPKRPPVPPPRAKKKSPARPKAVKKAAPPRPKGAAKKSPARKTALKKSPARRKAPARRKRVQIDEDA